MSTIVDRFATVVTKPFLREFEVAAATQVADGFQRVDLRVGFPVDWAVGQKVQVHLRGFEFRTYTPFDWSSSRVSLLAALDATGPGTAAFPTWAAGQRLELVGPRKAVDLSKVDDVVFVGDETSFALGAAWEGSGSGTALAHLHEVSHPATARAACEAVGLGAATLVVREAGDAHLGDLSARVLAAVSEHPDATLVLTGKAQTIRAVRGAVKDAGLSPAVRVKAHWDPNRTGLD